MTEDVFYQPIPRYNTDKPLTDCVITVSSYAAHEKDTVINLLKLLGATVQNSLSLKKTPEILANTHLVCKSAAGPKYVAAKSWHMPIVGVDWIIECCVTGNRAPEDKFSITSARDKTELIKALASIRELESDSTYAASENCKASFSNTHTEETTLNIQPFEEVSNEATNETKNANNSSLTCPNESKKPRLDKSKSKAIKLLN